MSGILVVIQILPGRARAGTLSIRVRDATLGVDVIGALPLGFQVQLGLVRGKDLPAGLHAAEASYVSASPLRPHHPVLLRRCQHKNFRTSRWIHRWSRDHKNAENAKERGQVRRQQVKSLEDQW